jgi:hypothetical protein
LIIRIERKPQKTSRIGQSSTWKATWRFIRSWICHNHKAYYTYVILSGVGVYSAWWYALIGYYRARNSHRSLEYALQAEAEWQLIKPKDDDDDDEDEEEEE